jgi:hypothetical protein
MTIKRGMKVFWAIGVDIIVAVGKDGRCQLTSPREKDKDETYYDLTDAQRREDLRQ